MDKKMLGLLAIGAGAVAIFYFWNKNKLSSDTTSTPSVAPASIITPVMVTPTVISQPQPNITSVYAPAEIYNPITATTTTTISGTGGGSGASSIKPFQSQGVTNPYTTGLVKDVTLPSGGTVGKENPTASAAIAAALNNRNKEKITSPTAIQKLIDMAPVLKQLQR